MNLEPFGIPGILNATFDFDSIDPFDINYGKRNLNFSENTRSFRMGGVTYTAVEVLGEGTVGRTYRCVSPDGSEFAIKRVPCESPKEFVTFLKECVIQILVVEASKSHPTGPYAPTVYEVAYDPATKEGFLRCEKMRNKLSNLTTALSSAEMIDVRTDAQAQITVATEFLYEELHFCYIDRKVDNLMYVRSPDDTERWWRFIDFSMSSVTIDERQINGGLWAVTG